MSFIFIYGRPGKGKTTFAASMTNLGYKVLMIDVDQKAKRMLNIAPLIKEGKLEVVEIGAKLTETNLRQRITTPSLAFTKQPKGYLEFCDLISSFEEMASKGQSHSCQVLVLDSLTSLLEHLDRLISQIQKKDHFTFDEWDILLTNLEELFYTLIRLQKLFKHVIVICHVQPVIDEETGRINAYLPSIKGSMRNKVGKYFDEIYFLDTTTNITTKQVDYKVLTQALPKYEARTSRNLPIWAPADFGLLYKEEKVPKEGKK